MGGIRIITPTLYGDHGIVQGAHQGKKRWGDIGHRASPFIGILLVHAYEDTEPLAERQAAPPKSRRAPHWLDRVLPPTYGTVLGRLSGHQGLCRTYARILR